MDHARNTLDIRWGLSGDRLRWAFTGSVSGVDAAGRGFADDGVAGAGRRDGSRFNAGARHAGDLYGTDSDHGAAVRLCFPWYRADALAARSRAEAACDARGIAAGSRRDPLERRRIRHQAARPADRRIE